MKQLIIAFSLFKTQSKKHLISLIITSIFIFIFSSNLNSQNQANNWYFGNGGGISFNSGSPIAFGNSALNSAEGVSSISDASGNILMYTDGLSLFNQNDIVMPNGSGLQGGNSSSQSAVIIRKPLSNNLYYLFTADQDAQPDGIRYSIVNMSLNGGLGDITATKNVLLHTPATEKLTAVMHCNKRDVWIIAHGWGDNDYMAWLLTPAGLTTTPITSSVGATQDQSVIGCMKASPDGKKLAFAVYDLGGQHYVQLCDFNPSTGSVSNPIIINTAGNCYGVEFSPNSKYLYYTGCSASASSTINIYQVDLCAGSNAAITSSSSIAGGSSVGFIRTIQLGPDGKLYFSRFGQNSIGVIDFPNLPAPACGFNVNGVTLSSGAICKAGLANFNQSFLKPQIPFTSNAVCLNVDFSADDIVNAASCHNAVQSINWNFGEASSGSSNTSTAQNPTHSYASPGTYSVQLIVHYSCNNDTLIQSVDVNCGPQVHVNDAIVCSGSCASIQATTVGGTPPYTYTWTNGIPTGSGPHSVCPLVNTQYIVTVTDASGQTDKDTASITVSSVPIPTINSQAVLCQGGNSGSASIILSGGPYTYQWVGYPALSGSTQNSLQAGTYPVIISNSNGCTRNASITVTQPLALTASISTTNTGCSLPSGSATVNASGGVSPYSYSWTGYAGTGNTLSSISAGTHSVTITDANSCSITLTYTINSSSGPTLSLQELQAVSCYNGSNGSLAMNVVGGLAPYTYQWSSGQTTAQLNGLSSGTYTASVTDLNGCVATASQTLMNPIALNTNVTSQSATCNLANGSASLNVSGAVSPIQIQWSTIPVQFGSVVNNLLPGNYSVLVTDGNGCSHNSSFSITNLPGAQVSSSSTSVSCFGLNDATINLSVITPDSYQVQWNTGQTGSQLNQIGAGTYTATVTTSVGCVSSVTEVISNPSPLQLSFSSISASCGSANGSVLATVTGGTSPYIYAWTGNSSVNSNSLSGILAGTYPLTVTDSHGCSISGNGSVSSMNGPSILISSQQDPTCFGASTGSASVTATGSALPLSILWSNGTSGSSVSGLVAGNYSAVVTDANGCQSSVSLTLNQPSSITSIVSTNPTICNASNGSIQLNLNGGTLPYTINWVGPSVATGINPSGLLTGNYIANITDAHGCTASASANVGSQLPPQVSISETQVISCPNGSNAQLLAQVTNGQSPFSYQWNTGQSGSSLSNLSSGSYSVTVTDASGCSATSSHVLTAPASWNISNQISSSTCGNPNGAIQLSISGGSSPYTCTWSSGQTGTLVNQLTSGVYSATIIDNHGCSTNYSGTVNDLGGVQLSITNQQDASCNGLANGSATLSISGGTAPYTISWPDGSQLTQRNNLAAGTYNVNVTDASSCQSSVAIHINEPAAISGNIQTTNASCGLANGTATLSLSGGVAPYTYQWSNGQTASSTSALAGNIGVLVTDAQGCSQNFVANIGSAQVLSATISQTHPISCPGGNDGELNLQISGGVAPYALQWSTGESSLAITTLSAGNYSVNVTDATGCSSNASFQISEPSNWSVQAITTSSTCGNANGSLQLTVSGASAPYSIMWSNSQTGLSANQLLAGTYTASISDALGCSTSSTYSVADAGGLQLSVSSQSDAHCAGTLDGIAQVQAVGGTAPYMYQWFDGLNASQRADLSAGNHLVTVTDANGCSASTQVLISEPSSLDGILTINDGTCGLANGSASIQANGGTLPYFYSWTNSSVLPTITGLSTGSIGVLVTDANGCQRNFIGTVGMAPALQVAATVTQSISCFGGSNGEVQLSGGSNLLVNWSNGQTGMNLQNVSAGSYSAIAVDAGGCSDTITVSLNEPAALSGQLNTHDATCFLADGDASLQVAGGTSPYVYSWSNGANVQSVSSLSAGDFSVQITDANGCQISLSGTISSQQNLQIQSIQVIDASCAGSSDGSANATIIGAVGNVTWNWSNGNTSQQAVNLNAGTYQVEVSDAAGCSVTQNFTIQQPISLSATVNKIDVSCHALSDGRAHVQVIGGTLPYTYSWDGLIGLDSTNQLIAGSHHVSVTDQHGCSVQVDFTIDQPEVLLAEIQTTPSVCGLPNGSMIGLAQGGTAPYHYSWSTGENLSQIAGLTSGAYNLSVSDSHGCTSSIIKSFQDPGSPVVSLIHAQHIACFGGADGSIEVTAQGGTGNLQLNWLNVNSENDSLNGLSSGSYTVIVSDEINCKDTLTIELTQPDALAISHSSIDVRCFDGSDGSIQLNPTGGTQPYTYLWSGSTNAFVAQESINQLSADEYHVLVIDAHVCQIEDTIQITQPELLSTTIHTLPARCFGEASGEIIAQTNGGTLPYTFQWSTGDQTANVDSLLAGNYQLLVSDVHGCVFSVQAQVLQPDELIASIGGTTKLCKGDSALLTASAIGGTSPFSYQWTAGIAQDQYTWNAVETHVEQVIVQDSKGCTDTISNELLVYELPIAEVVSAQTSICAGTCVDFSAAPVNGGTYVWSDSQNRIHTGQTVSFCYDDATTVGMTLQVTDNHGCENRWTANSYLTVHPLPEIGFEPDHFTIPLLQALVHFENTTTGALSYIWDFDPRTNGLNSTDISPSYQYTEIGDYPVTLIATNEFGCSAQLQRTITVNEDFAVYFPSAFTPNADGLNDRFIPSGVGISSEGFNMQIYNRWGNVVFETKNLGQGWDGSYSSKEGDADVASEVFIWQVSLTDFTGLVREYRGSVTLIR